MPRTQQQNELIRETTRAKLLDSAMLLYAEYGYAHTSIRKITTHAIVSRAWQRDSILDQTPA